MGDPVYTAAERLGIVGAILIIAGALSFIWWGNPYWDIVNLSRKVIITGLLLVFLACASSYLWKEVAEDE